MCISNKIAKFEKVSFEQFLKDCADTFDRDMTNSGYVEVVRDTYDRLQLPKRGTKGSAGYDFYSPVGFDLNPGETIKLPMGIKCSFDCNWVLQIYPRSSVGFKYRIRLENTVGIIDSDYYNNENNEGHIFVKITNCGDKMFSCDEGDAIVQGIFLPYGITVDDDTDSTRVGGFGSTGK